GGKTCYCASLIDLTGVDFFSERDFKFRGNIDLSKENSTFLADLDVDIDSAGVKYPYKMPRGFKKPFAEKGLWLGAGDLIRDRYTRVDPGTLNKVKVAHPGGDTFAADALPIAADQTISWNLTAGGEWHCGLQPAIGGRELSAVFSAGDYARAAFFVWSGGWVAIGAGQSSIGVTLYKKDIGQPIITAVQTWRGASDHEQWRSSNCEWTVRIYNENLAALVMNGTEVYRFQVPNGGIFTEYGFGVLASANPIVAGVSRWTERTTQSFGGQAQVAIAVFGDSKASPFYGVWTDACREALDGSFGVRCIDMQNHAVAGSNSLNILNKMQDVGLGIANYVIIDAFTNDQQQGSPLSASLSNLQAMLNKVTTEGRRPVVPIHPLYLNTVQTPDGFATANAEKGAELRAAVRTMAASYNAVIVDTQQLTGQILADFINSPDISDPRLRDRIHYTPFAYRLIGWTIARAIAGDIVVSASAQMRRTEFPVRYFSNGWHATLRAPYITVDASRVVQMEGILEAGTTTDGTTIISFPVNLRPAGWRSFPSYSVRLPDGRRTSVLLEISSGGDLKIYGMPSDDNYIYLDPIKYEAS
ncbi:SGNH/GDSL hydrolase family protein, partial [Agrobacterium tumefaciens]|uniref:SGNH/GDSL hydrolase family protein n=1 Tax=Agrobacterium tumefaciens TaxID=358 RepID=UPI0015742FF4